MNMHYADIAVAAGTSGQMQSLADAVSGGGGAAPGVVRRKDGAKAPQYTREQMAQAANKGRVATPTVAGVAAAEGHGKVKSLRETVAKNAADYLLK